MLTPFFTVYCGELHGLVKVDVLVEVVVGAQRPADLLLDNKITLHNMLGLFVVVEPLDNLRSALGREDSLGMDHHEAALLGEVVNWGQNRYFRWSTLGRLTAS